MIFLNPIQDSNSLPVVLMTSVLSDKVSSSATSALAGSHQDNLLTDTTFDQWIFGDGNQYCYFEFLTGKTINCIGIANHNMGKIEAILAIYSLDNLLFYGAITSDDPILITIPETTSLRYLVNVQVPVGKQGYISVVKMGQRITIPTTIAPPYVPINRARRVELLNSVSMGNNFLGNSSYPKGRETDVTFNNLAKSFIDGAFAEFAKHYDNGRAFFFAGSPSLMPLDVGYCWRREGAGELRSENTGGDWVNLKMGLAIDGA